MAEKFQHIRIDLIDEDVSNHRLVVDQLADDALVASIKANGVQQPIKVTPKDSGRFTLVFGFRRKAAAIAAGLDEIPALVIEGVTPEKVRSLQAIENLERKDLHPLEEARFCQDLHDELEPKNHGGAYLPEQIAQRIGRSVKWVESRLSLARLSPRVKECFLDGDIHLQHALLIGRLVSHDAQEDVLGSVKAQDASWLKGRDRVEGKRPPATIGETRRLVDARVSDLTDVPWKLDAEFAGKPACKGCPHNSANRLDLFDGDAPKKPQCLNAPCYKLKRHEAGLAVRRASNTLAKSEDANTPTNARKAIKERGVEFVDEKAVAAAAKHKMPATKNVGKSKATAAESKGAMNRERKDKINDTLRERMHAWLRPIEKETDKKIKALVKDPIAAAMILLISVSDLPYDSHYTGSAQKAAQLKLSKAIKLLKNPSVANLAAVAELLHADFRDNYAVEEFGINSYHDSPFFRQQICELCGYAPTSPMPTFEAIEAELYPTDPETSATQKTAVKKKRVSKKAGGKVTYHQSSKKKAARA